MDEAPLSILCYSVLLFEAAATKIPASVYDVIPLVRQSQRHRNTLTHSLAKLSILKTHFFLALSLYGRSQT